MTKIQQHMYTRERAGVFSSTPGYDTVAKSKGLSHTYIKKVMDPLCTYNAPQELSRVGERDERKYPKAKLISFTETGELIIGQSVYKQADYTGERATFFSHHYIVPNAIISESFSSPREIFGQVSFQTEYDISHGKQLVEMVSLPSESLHFKPLHILLTELEISSNQYQQLLFALLVSLTSKKKVYVTLSGEISHSTDTAFQLTYYLFQCIPYELRKYFGFISYHAQPKSKKNICLMFVEKGSIRPQDSSLAKDFIFDFSQAFFRNTNETIALQPFLTFAFESVQSNPDNLEAFYKFAEISLSDMKDVSFLPYNELTRLYFIKQGDIKLYEQNDTSILKCLYSLLTRDNRKEKADLYAIMVKIINVENQKITAETLPNDEKIKLIIQFFTLIDDQDYKIFTLFFVKLLYYGRHDLSFIQDVYKLLMKYPDIFKIVNQEIFKTQKFVSAIFEPYIIHRLKTIVLLKDLDYEVKYWLEQSPEYTTNAIFLDQTIDAFISIFQREKNQLKAYNEMKRKLQSIKATNHQHEVDYFNKSILQNIARFFFQSLEMKSLSADQFLQASVLINDIPKQFRTKEMEKQARFINDVNDIMENHKRINIERYSSLPNFKGLQSTILKFIPDSYLEEHTERIALGFYNNQHSEGNYFRYDDMFAYIYKKGSLEAVRNHLTLFSWIGGVHHLKDEAFKEALRNFIIEHGKKIHRDKQTARKWDNTSIIVKKTMEEVRYEQLSYIAKFFKSNGKRVILGSMVLVMTLGVAGGIWAVMEQNKRKVIAVENKPNALPSKPIVINIDKKTIYVDADKDNEVSKQDSITFQYDQEVYPKLRENPKNYTIQFNEVKLPLVNVEVVFPTDKEKNNSITIEFLEESSENIQKMFQSVLDEQLGKVNTDTNVQNENVFK